MAANSEPTPAFIESTLPEVPELCSTDSSSAVARPAADIESRYTDHSVSEFIQTPAVMAHLNCARLESGTVHYCTAARIGFALGSPIAEPDSLRSAAAEFDAHLAGRGMRSVYFGVEEMQAHRLAPGRRQVLIGSQPILTAAAWRGIKSRSSGLRAQIKRGMRGMRIIPISSGKHPYAASMANCLDAWLATRPAPPMGFAADARLSIHVRKFHRIYAAVDDTGDVQAYLCLSAVRGSGKYLAEHIIRRPHAPNGVIEALIDHLFSHHVIGAEAQLSLGLVALSERYLQTPHLNPRSFRFMRWLARSMGNRAYRFRSLEQFRRRLCPLPWSPVFLLADDDLAMPSLAVGLVWLFFRPVRRPRSAA
ncbi:MAG: phosphatidylglycerol lysyltransferase domain-containing protein [Phycisphaerae bacterium]